jgi:hypothetical protein
MHERIPSPIGDAEIDDIDRRLSSKSTRIPAWQVKKLVDELRAARGREQRRREALRLALAEGNQEALLLAAQAIVDNSDPLPVAEPLPEAD